MPFLSIIKRWFKEKSKEAGMREKTAFFLAVAAAIILLSGVFMIGYLLGRNSSPTPIIIEQKG